MPQRRRPDHLSVTRYAAEKKKVSSGIRDILAEL
jgi:hypothetical protein